MSLSSAQLWAFTLSSVPGHRKKTNVTWWTNTSTFINGDKPTGTGGRIRGGNFLLRYERLLSTKQLHSDTEMPRREGEMGNSNAREN